LLCLIWAAALLAAGCSRSAAPAAAGAPAVPVQVAAAVQQDMPRRLESIGNVQSLRSVAIKSQVDGIIAQVHIREGEEVKVGDLLFTLDRRPFENSLRIARADLLNAQAEAGRAKADADRYTRLDQQDAISKEQYAQLMTAAETTRANAQAKEAAVANAELQLGYTEIRAPIAGRTGQIQLHEGSLVKANDVTQTIVTINQFTPVSVAYSVPESSLNTIRAALLSGDAVVTVIDRNAGLTRTDGKLEFLDNSVDPTTGTIVLKAIFPNTDAALWPGQFVSVQTQFGVDHGAIVIPSSAVQNGQNGAQVYVVKADTSVELRPVTVTRTVGDSTLIATGVKAGETVVTDGQLRLVPGAKVLVKKPGDTAAAAGAGGQP
jgi:multidrug efflux system membrane fusion protein